MSSTLKALGRVLALLMMIAVTVSSSRDAVASEADAIEPAMALLGDGSCGFEDDEEKLVVCGREMFGDFVDVSFLVMPEGQCSVLLDELFSQQLCAFDDPDCHRFSPAAPVPPLPKLQTSSSTTTLVTRRDAGDPVPRSSWLRASDEDIPSSLSSSPPERPPRGSNA